MDIKSLFGISGKKVLITGGSRGIGLMIAEGFVSNGAKVYISSRSSDVCDKVAKELTAQGEAISLPANLQELSEVKRLVSEIEKIENGKLDILINNAGVAWAQNFDEYTDKAFEKVMNLNLKRIFDLTQVAMPLLENAATPEDPSRVPLAEAYAYAASKAALIHLTRVMAGHLSNRNVTFNCVLPGPFESKMTKKFLDANKKLMISNIPLGRIGRSEDVAGTCIYLASKAGAFTNGALVTIDGGNLCKPKL
ncbi:16352_t:CDS:2 [Entrophospora sp. SA101]|nr:16352_t:CDS:2 [Entrophospora sp. SA101]CAJ0827761.1 1719_t:CDS:2 [Entrophospora sp. SA101]CAJ0848468.1 2064_t:CDS:2 [Entrophospora sp. SA101]